MLSGAVGVVRSILEAIAAHPDHVRWFDFLFIFQIFLMLGGVVGLHALQKGSYERIGWKRFYTTIGASLILVVGLVVDMPESLFFGWLRLTAYLFMLVGFVLLGVATLQAKILPRWCGVGLIISLPTTIPLEEFGGMLFGLLLLALGYVLWSRRGTPAGRPLCVR